MRSLSALEIGELLSVRFGLDSDAHQQCPIVYSACLLRHVAGRICPCTPRKLVSTASELIVHQAGDAGTSRELIGDLLDVLIGYGDLLQIDVSDTNLAWRRGSGDLVYLAPPAYLVRQSGMLLVFGVHPDEGSAIAELSECMRHRGHVRYVPVENSHVALTLFGALGYIEATEAHWLKGPRQSPPSAVIDTWDNRLNAVRQSGDMPDLVVLDSTKPVKYYRGRWTSPARMSGRFIGRRKQRFGADLWCYVELSEGLPQRFVDMPSGLGPWRGCDEAWYLQSAIDAIRNAPQQGITESTQNNRVLLRLFSPVPCWVQRRWDALGMRVEAPGCLFAYEFREDEVAEEIAYLRGNLWMSITSA